MRSRFVHLWVVPVALFVGFVFVGRAIAEELIRVGVPTKAYFPTVQAKAAIDRKLFEKEGLRCELTVYRGGGEAFEALPPGLRISRRCRPIWSPLPGIVASCRVWSAPAPTNGRAGFWPLKRIRR